MITCCVVGLGYIGLPTAAVLARAGHRVIGVDVNAHVVDIVNQGLIHIVEPDLDQAVAASVASGALSAQLTPAPADVFLIAVPTPFRSGVDGLPLPNIDFGGTGDFQRQLFSCRQDLISPTLDSYFPAKHWTSQIS